MNKLTICAVVTLLMAGMASAGTFELVSNPNIAINDFTEISTDIFNGTSGTITDLDVDVIIEHTWQGDLIIELEKLGGPRIPLIYRPGDSDGTGAGFSENNFGVPGQAPFIFDDEAAAFYDTFPADGIGAIADPGIFSPIGNWRPYGSQASGLTDTLSTFDGLDAFGTWRLWVSDNAGGDQGALLQFSLHFTTGEPIPEPATVALLCAGAGLFLLRRRRRTA